MEEFRMGKKSLELCCYVAGAGAFGVFLRWLQVQLAFNELGLPDPSGLHIVVLLFVAVCAAVFYYFIRRFAKARLYLPDDFSVAFSNNGRLYSIVRVAAGIFDDRKHAVCKRMIIHKASFLLYVFCYCHGTLRATLMQRNSLYMPGMSPSTRGRTAQ